MQFRVTYRTLDGSSRTWEGDAADAVAAVIAAQHDSYAGHGCAAYWHSVIDVEPLPAAALT